MVTFAIFLTVAVGQCCCCNVSLWHKYSIGKKIVAFEESQ